MSVDTSAVSGVRRWLVALMFLSLFGVADSVYLLLKHRGSMPLTSGSGGSAFCPTRGCDVVNQGEYAEVGGVPLAAIGLAGYLTILGLSVLTATRRDRRAVQVIVILSGVGLIVSAYLVYLQVAVIKAICSWCVVSAFTMVSIFILSIVSLGNVRPPDQPGRAGQQRAFQP